MPGSDGGIIPPLILTKEAVSETVRYLNLSNPEWERTVQDEIREAIRLEQRAIDCVWAVCASGALTMVVVEPNTGQRHAIPARYFKERSAAEFEFRTDKFGDYEVPDAVASDPLFKLLRPYRGWIHGFIEPDFRTWLANPEFGPIKGSWMRPFSYSAYDLAVDPVSATADPVVTEERPAPATRGRKPGSGTFDDTDSLRKMLALLAEGKAPSVWAAAGQNWGGKLGSESKRRRLDRKFRERFGTKPPAGKTWADIEF